MALRTFSYGLLFILSASGATVIFICLAFNSARLKMRKVKCQKYIKADLRRCLVG